MAGMVSAMGIAQKCFGSVAGPLDISVEFFRRPCQADIFSIQINFGSETSAHIGRDDPNFVFRQTHDESRHQQPLHVGVLVGNPQRVFVVGAAVGANGSTRLHGIGHQPVVDQIQLGHMGGMGKCGVHL